ncbi:MAG: hypothetical protein AB8B50_16475 [Pirellulaceae bacterium]
MADHWKSIANLLGAPGVDLPEDDNEQVEKSQDSSVAEQAEKPAVGGRAVEEANAGGATSAQTTSALDSSEVEASVEVKQEEPKPRKKPRRESRPPVDADMSVRFSEQEPTEPEKEEPEPVEASANTDDGVEVISAVAAKSKTPVESTSAKKKPKKKARSSWGKIADLFGVGSGDEEELAEEDVVESPEALGEADAVDVIASDVSDVVQTRRGSSQGDDKRGPREEGRRPRRGDRKRPPRGDRKRDTKSDSAPAESKKPVRDDEPITDDMLSFKTKPKAEPSLSIFDEDSTDDGNPALKEMFGEASGGFEDSWSSGAKVIDDVSWEAEESDDVEGSGTEDADQPVSRGRSGSSRSDRDAKDDDGETKSERGGRRRRGRRGRGRGRDEQVEKRDEEVAGDEASRTDPWDKASVESSTDQWDEPESFAGGDNEEAEVQRRSNRRRRRGRNRGGEETAGAEEPSKELEARSSEPAEADDSAAEEEWPSRERAPRGGSRGGARRGNRDSERGGRDEERGESTRRRRPRPEIADTDEGNQGRTRGDADDSEEDEETPKHRNIPAWADALETLVSANIQNHKRNDSRGRGGRSRGRR